MDHPVWETLTFMHWIPAEYIIPSVAMKIDDSTTVPA